jgi:hypothetical protein
MDAEAQWRDTIDRRSCEIEEGRVIAVPWRKPSETFAPSSMHVAVHPEAEQELESAVLW